MRHPERLAALCEARLFRAGDFGGGNAVAAFTLGSVESGVSVIDEIFESGRGVAMKSGHTETGSDANFRRAIDEFIFLALAADAFGDGVDVVLIGVGEDEHELFSPDAGADI
jgi:hypothetical protein